MKAGLIGIIVFVWVSMLFGLWAIWKFVVPLQLPNPVLSGMAQVSLGAGLVALWLWAWRKITNTYFWQTIKKKKQDTARAYG
jgi:hypothetical protein